MIKKRVNLNNLARIIASMERGKIEISIAQVKEVLACLGRLMRRSTPDEALAVLAALVRRGGRRS